MKKSGFIAMVAVMMLAFGGCGTSANNLGGATDGYGYGYNSYGYNNYDSDGSPYGGYSTGTGTYTDNGAAYWDGYGINSGRPLMDNTAGNTLANDTRTSLGNGITNANTHVNPNTATVAS